MSPFVVPNALQASKCDEQLLKKTHRATGHVEIVIPLVHDFNPSLVLRFPTTIASEGSMILSGSTIKPPFKLVVFHLCNCRTLQLVLGVCSSCFLQLVLHRFTISIVSTANLFFGVFLVSLDSMSTVLARDSVCPIFAQLLNFRAPKCFSSTCLQELILMPR